MRIRKYFHLPSIALQLLLAFLLVVLTPVIIISATSAVLSYQVGRQHARDQLNSIATLKAAEIDLWTGDLANDLDVWLGTRDMSDQIWPLLAGQLAPAEARQAHDRILASLQAVVQHGPLQAPIFVLDVNGKVVVSTEPTQENMDLSQTSYYRQGLQKAYLTPPFHVSPEDSRLVIVVARPILQPGQGAVGVVAAYSDLTVLDDILAEPAGLGQTGESYVVSMDSAPLSRLRYSGGISDGKTSSEGIRAALVNKIQGWGLYSDYHQRPVVGVYRWLPELQVVLMVEQDQAEAFSAAAWMLGLNLSVSAGAALLTVLIAMAITRSIARPLRQLANTATAIAAGDLTGVVDIRRPDEIGQLAAAFQHMTQQLRELIEALRAEQQALRVALEKYRVLFDSFPLGITMADQHGLIVETNQQAEQLLGVPRDEHMRRTVDGPEWHLVRPDGRPLPADEFASTIALREHRRVTNMEMGIVHAPGRTIWLSVTAAPIPLEGYGVAVVYGDISDRKQSEALIQDQQERLTTQNEELLAQNEELVHQGRALAAAEAELRDSNQKLEARVQARSLELRAANADLQMANAALLRASRLKDEFLANMSHELRTPLTGILGLAEALDETVYGPLSERQRHAVSVIHDSGDHLLALINDILDLSKVEAGKLDLQAGPVDVAEICQISQEFIQAAARKKRIACLCRRDEAVRQIWADSRRLKQMLVNLLSNAVKFTPEGGQIGLEVVGNAAASEVTFRVWDTGIGIPPERQKDLFQPFVQLDGGLARQYEGTGLGLALVRTLAALHGGRVTVESAGTGQGACFRLTLPWSPGLMAGAAAAPPAGVSPLKQVAAVVQRLGRSPTVLAVDDSPSTLTVVADFLEAAGCQVLTAANGAQGLETALTAPVDLVLLDIQMPDMDGFTVLRTLRRQHSGPPLPVIVLTALTMAGDRERCLAAGANDYLSKPMNLETLAQAVARQLELVLPR